ncbi:protein AF-10 isoform X3 [Conger conger]|uniref:protein AF-10 isoform X3 n=1 Tax=Conger conger TaxID=82655 RepID=UPI002A5A41E2|nr:protein AF-10 isoform X3 [Conger conger]
MVSSEPSLPVEDDYFANNMKEMIGGCCVCSDERGWAENPLVYCDGHGCNVAVHQACYGIVQVPTGPWFCRKCESQERAARVLKGWKGRKPSQQALDGGRRASTQHKAEEDERLAKSLKTMNTWRCELCPHKDGALKRTDNGGWAHVVCALYIPEVEFANVSTMEPIVLQSVPHERYNKTCYICEEQGRESKAASGACMTCNKHGCRQAFHVTCAQFAGLLCEEQGSDADNVKYCGYCKYHYSKLRRSKGRGSRAQSLSDSSSHSLDKHHDKDKKKHKDRDRHKPKHRKASEPSSALVPPLMVTSEKAYSSSSVTAAPSSQKRLDDGAGRFTNANFQEVPTHPGAGAKEGGSTEGKGLEGKSKRAGSHGSGQRGRKSMPGKPALSVVVSTATSVTVSSSSSSSSSSSPFQQGLLLGSSTKPSSGGSVSQPTQDFQSFSEPSLRSDPLFGRGLPKLGGEGGSTEGVVTLSTFGSLMSLAPSSASPGAKHFENSHLPGELGGLAPAAYKRPQASGTGSGAEEATKGKKRRCNWRNRYGPCRPRELPELPGHPAPAPPPSSSPSSCMSLMPPGRANPANSSSGIQKSPSLLRNGGLQSLSVSSSPLGPGVFPSSDPLVPLMSAVSGPNAPLSSTEIPQQLPVVPSLPSTPLLPPLPHSISAGPLSSTACTYSNALPGSSFNLAPSHMFGNRLNPNSAMAAMMAQSESASTDQELGDNAHGFPGRGASPKANLSPRSPVGGLQIRYDPPGPPGPLLPSSGVGDGGSLPPVATSIEQLLERQWNEGQQFLLQQGTQGDVLSMLKSLHQLQVENQRLEEQIKNLTMKKERLQLLSDQLSVPFPPASSMATASSPELHPSNTPTDGINSCKSFHLGSSFLPDSSFNLTTQDTSCGHSSSSSSLSTPPSVAHSPPQPPSQVQQVNGMGVAGGAAAASLPGMAGVTGLMGALQGGPLAMSGIVRALNGVIQTPPGLAQNSSPLSHPAAVPNASLSIPSSLNNSVARLGLLSEQQRQILLHQHQLQQLFTSPQPTPEQQQQALLYQLMQQQHQQQHDLQQLQQFSSSQLPINSLLPAAQGAIASNPFLAMHADAASAQKSTRLVEKAGSSGGQEKS